uniref:Uncharacterized protein n=1 Tax=Parascaris univalens TaxID=6257 RepID=A0A914ZT34_PARUN
MSLAVVIIVAFIAAVICYYYLFGPRILSQFRDIKTGEALVGAKDQRSLRSPDLKTAKSLREKEQQELRGPKITQPLPESGPQRDQLKTAEPTAEGGEEGKIWESTGVKTPDAVFDTKRNSSEPGIAAMQSSGEMEQQQGDGSAQGSKEILRKRKKRSKKSRGSHHSKHSGKHRKHRKSKKKHSKREDVE